ncbi:sulfite exporter TauE/SafE family protein [Mucilaginibacter antarcticus]|uniref:sulfite exporter TauE/SafE family protein n=1 Tax=Mucilaginibacter antarcticus TaxID=1855725 RepID=UPI00363DB950
MSVIELTVIILIGSYFAGLLGSLTGLGGGFIIIPLFSLVLGINIHYAIGASLVSVIATSSGSAAAFIKEGITNMRLGMFLEVATTLGALAGAMLAIYTSTHYIAVLFGCILIMSAVMSLLKKSNETVKYKSRLAERLKLNSSYPTADGIVKYNVVNVGGGFYDVVCRGNIRAVRYRIRRA